MTTMPEISDLYESFLSSLYQLGRLGPQKGIYGDNLKRWASMPQVSDVAQKPIVRSRFHRFVCFFNNSLYDISRTVYGDAIKSF
jgi:hypothetical protein